MGGSGETVGERTARGRAARRDTPRTEHARFDPPANRPDPLLLLEAQAVTRVADLVPIRYGRMLASPFAFFRGAALIMASDLAGTPRSGLQAQLCGDAHLSNFGVFASPERRLVFDLNDFDETLPGPWEWDVKRLAASFAVLGRENGLADGERRSTVLATVSSYRQAMRRFAGMREMDVWYARAEVDDLLGRLQGTARKRTKRLAGKAHTRDSLAELAKLTETVDGEPRIVSRPPLVVPVRDLAAEGDIDAEGLTKHLTDALHRFRDSLQSDRRALLERFRLVDIARKVVGVGSVGTRDWIVLLAGRDERDPLFLQFKEAQPSVLEEFTARSPHTNDGERVTSGQRLMQAASDILLGWLTLTGGPDTGTRDYYGRQLKDWKGSFEAAGASPASMALYGRACGWTLARGHARSGDAIAIAAYLGSGDVFDRAIADFAEAYADQNQRDHDALAQAVSAGRIEARTGV